VRSEDENVLLERFVAVLFGVLTDPSRRVGVALAPVFERLLEGYWELGLRPWTTSSRLHRAAKSCRFREPLLATPWSRV
jgi:hypothetical protein